MQDGSPSLVSLEAFRVDSVIILATALTCQADGFKLLEVLAAVFTAGDQLQGVGTRGAFDRYGQGSRGRVNRLPGVTHCLVGFVINRGFNRDVLVGHQGKADVANAFIQYILGGDIMNMHVSHRVRDQSCLHLIAGHTALRFGVEIVGALGRLNTTLFVTHTGPYRLVRSVHGFGQFKRPVCRLPFFYRIDTHAEAVLRAFSTAHESPRLGRITW